MGEPRQRLAFVTADATSNPCCGRSPERELNTDTRRSRDTSWVAGVQRLRQCFELGHGETARPSHLPISDPRAWLIEPFASRVPQTPNGNVELPSRWSVSAVSVAVNESPSAASVVVGSDPHAPIRNAVPGFGASTTTAIRAFRLRRTGTGAASRRRAGAADPKGFELLEAFLEQPGRLLSKDELLKRVWPNIYVEVFSGVRPIHNRPST